MHSSTQGGDRVHKAATAGAPPVTTTEEYHQLVALYSRDPVSAQVALVRSFSVHLLHATIRDMAIVSLHEVSLVNSGLF